MRAMIMNKPGEKLQAVDLPKPQPQKNQLLIKVQACGICRTDLHVMDGELKQPKLPLVLGHQIVGTIEERGPGVSDFQIGQRVGVPWLGASCQHCGFCLDHSENLCDEARFTGYQFDGGLAEYCLADPRFSFLIPDCYSDLQAAPLLCAGLIGYRTLSKVPTTAQRIGIYGFGAAGHLVIQMAIYQKREVYVFTKPNDQATQAFARQLGAKWAGDADQVAPVQLDAALIFAPSGDLVPRALASVGKAGVVVCGGIYMSEIPSFPYELLWGERSICSVANLTRRDGEAFLALAPHIPIQTEVTVYPLHQANEALDDLRQGRFRGAAVIKI